MGEGKNEKHGPNRAGCILLNQRSCFMGREMMFGIIQKEEGHVRVGRRMFVIRYDGLIVFDFYSWLCAHIGSKSQGSSAV